MREDMALPRLALTTVFLLAALLAPASAERAPSSDLHGLYERHCAQCHPPHAGDFARDALERRGGEIVGRASQRAVRAFLTDGHGRLAAADVGAMVTHLAAIVDAGGLFQDKCRICHGRATDFARTRFIVRDGRLTARFTGRDVATFLSRHGRIGGAEIETIVDMLTRQGMPRAGD